MQKVLILLGSKSDLPITESGLKFLRENNISFSLRICSAHRTPKKLHTLIDDFEQQNGQVYIAVAGMSAHLAGVVAAATTKPVLAVPVYRSETAGFDALLSMGQMPKGIPVATLGFGKSGFLNSAILATQMLALSDQDLSEKLQAYKSTMAELVEADDRDCRINF